MLLLNQLRFSGYRSFRGQLGDDWDQASSLPLRRLTTILPRYERSSGKKAAETPSE